MFGDYAYGQSYFAQGDPLGGIVPPTSGALRFWQRRVSPRQPIVRQLFTFAFLLLTYAAS